MRCRRDGFSLDAGIAKRRALPDWYLDEPYTPDDLRDFYLEAFNDLNTERPRGMDLGPIPRSKIVDYANEHQLDDENRGVFVRTIRAMDDAWLAWAASETERERKLKEGAGG